MLASRQGLAFEIQTQSGFLHIAAMALIAMLAEQWLNVTHEVDFGGQLNRFWLVCGQ